MQYIKVRYFIVIIYLILLSLPTHTYAQDAVGRVIVKEGEVFIKAVGVKEEKPLHVKDPIHTGDMIRTGIGAVVKIVFQDNSILTMSQQTQIEINQFIYAPEGKRSVTLKLLKGRLKAVVSKAMEMASDTFKVRTPTAVIGIRGTRFVVGYNPDLRLTEVFVLEGMVAVSDLIGGEGREVILHENQATRVSEGEVPEPPEEIPREERQELEQEGSLSIEDYIDNEILEGMMEEERKILEAEEIARSLKEEEILVEEYDTFHPPGDDDIEEMPPIEQDIQNVIIKGTW